MLSWLQRILVPSPSVLDPGDRARVRLLQGFLLVASGVACARAIAQTLSADTTSTPMVVAAATILVGAFLTARTARWRASAAIATFVPTVIPIVIGIRNPDDPTWFAITVVGTLLASTFFSLRVAAATAAFSLSGVSTVITLSPGLQVPDRAIPILALVIMTTGLFLFIARHRDHLAAMHATELQARERQKGQALRLEAVGRLAAGVAHDSNNLLTVVMCNTEMLMNASDDDRVQQLAQEILDAGERTSSLVAGLLAFTHQHHREVSHFDLGEAVEQLVPFLRRLVGDGVELRFEGPDEPLPLSVDREHLFQVVLNLVVNARDATPKGGAIVVSACRDADGDTACLQVADTGCGIPEDVRDQVFEPFFTTKSDGNGLGLAIIHDNVQEMAGSIDLTTGADGTTFFVRLPLSAAPQPEAQPAEASTTSGMRLLLVDDDALVRRATTRGLKAAGYTVVSVASGEAALAELSRGDPFALLITDVQMPEMSGPELFRKVLTVAPELPTLFTSAYDAPELETVAAGTRFLSKPFSHDELREAVEDAIRGGLSNSADVRPVAL